MNYPNPQKIRAALESVAGLGLTSDQLASATESVALAISPDYEQAENVLKSAIVAMGEKERLAYWLWLALSKPQTAKGGSMHALISMGYTVPRLAAIADGGEPMPSLSDTLAK